jgi:lipid II:glycine glycyltransferase (peptidoglycan interpeptide bridge formation enzyme)
MIRIRGRGAVYGEVWFDEEPPIDPGVDIVVYRRRQAPIAGAQSAPFLSLFSDLSLDEQAILDQFGKDCRYKIRRADTKDRLRTEFFVDPEPRLDEFCVFYDAFAQQKSFLPADQQWLAAACEAHQLALSSASQDGESLVWHAYLISGKTTWLQYTGSCFRNKANDYRALIGRANRWLHWQDMLRFKAMEIERYDWGGLFEDESVPERAGINNFKKDFSGQPVRTYDCTVPVTMRGRIYLPLRDAWRRRKPLLGSRVAQLPRSDANA